jgi:4-amino-4-deoxy-L-arabinose transferase-like glycosyltransferase
LQLSALAKRAWLLLFIAIAGFYLWGLGSFPLVGPDEPRYAEVAREMLVRRDFITPTLGGLPWFEKPPLLYWMMMLSYRVLGVSEYAVRLGPAICGLLTGVFVYWIGSTVDEANRNERADEKAGAVDTAIGRWSALVWLSSLGAIGFSRGATFDIVLTMTVSGSLACFFVFEVRARSEPGSPRGQPTWGGGNDVRPGNSLLLGFYFFAGLSLLAKGLIGFVIIFGVVAIYFIVRRELPTTRIAKSFIWGLPLSLAVAGIWYGPMIARHGWTFIDQFIIQHHFARFVTNKYHHPGPVYFYLPVLVGLVLPWTIVLAASFLSARRWNWRGELPRDRALVFAVLWLLVPLVFFSFSGSKLTAYILPALPAAALLMGERIACFCRDRRGEKVLRLTGALLVFIAAAGVWYTHRNSALSSYWTDLAALSLLLIGATAIVKPQLRHQLFLMISIAALATAAIGLKCAAPAIARTQSVRDLFATADARGYANAPVVQLHTIERSAEFYAANRITYGSDGEPVKFEGATQVVEAARKSSGSVLCLVPVEYEAQLTTLKQANSEIVGNNGRVALIVMSVK